MLKKYQPLLLVLLAYVIIGVFYPTITANFVNLDDNVMVLGNDYIKSFSLSNLKEIFTTPYYKLYHPLVTLSFAFEYFFCKLDPFLYHFDNLLLHILNTLLVFFIIKRFSKSFIISYFTALIFAIHPLHVEVVSWISSRKDTLYSFFFLLSVLTYMKMDDGKKIKGLFFISIFSFFLSCLSKPTAVTLPLFLMLIDFCMRKLSFGRLKNYIPYILISALFVYIAVHFHYSPEEKIIATLFFKYVNFISAHLNILFYGYKFIFPVSLSCLYPYFFSSHTMMPWYVLYSPVVLYTLILFAFLSLEYTRKIFFGFFFFFFALLPSSGVMPTGVAPVADRYAYLAIIGLAYILVEFLKYIYKKSLYLKIFVICFSVCMLGAWSYLTYSRNIIWLDSIELMTEAVNYSPDMAAHAYLTRGIIEKGKENLDVAEADLDKSYNIANDNVTIYFHMAHLKQLQKKYDEALNLYSKIPDTYYDYGIVINNVGLILGEQGKNEQAIKYLKKQIAKRGDDCPLVDYLYSNLAMLYFKEKKYDESLKYVKLACEKDPSNYVYYVQMMVIYNEKDDFENFEKVAFEGLEKTDNNVNIINELANKYFMIGRYDDVEKLFIKEQNLDSDNHRGFFLLGSIAAIKGNFKIALIYYTMAIETSKENAEYYAKRAAVYLILGNYEKAKHDTDIAEKKGAVIDEDFKEGLNLLKQQIVEQERKVEEEQKFTTKFENVKEYRANAKKIQENIVASDIEAIKNTENRKMIAEEITGNRIAEIKNMEERKKIEEQNTANELKSIKEKEIRRIEIAKDIASGVKTGRMRDTEQTKTFGEIKSIRTREESRIEQENRIFGLISVYKWKEFIRKQIEEDNTAKRLKEKKERDYIELMEELEGKKEQEDIIYSGITVFKNRESIRKQIQEEAVALSLKMKTELSKKEMEAKKEYESQIFALLNILKNREILRRQIEEDYAVNRLKAVKNMEARKAFEEKKFADVFNKKSSYDDSFDIYDLFEDDDDDEYTDKIDEDSAFNI